ncbi:hypothetical protein ACOMHN_051930 [Nucella lapillus]
MWGTFTVAMWNVGILYCGHVECGGAFTVAMWNVGSLYCGHVESGGAFTVVMWNVAEPLLWSCGMWQSLYCGHVECGREMWNTTSLLTSLHC